MEDYADEYATQFEAATDPDFYWKYMRRSVDQSQTAMWKRLTTRHQMPRVGMAVQLARRAARRNADVTRQEWGVSC